MFFGKASFLKSQQIFSIILEILTLPLSLSMENGVIGEPKVDCGVESISVWIRTKRLFQGRVYVDEEYEHSECLHNYSPGANGGSLSNGYDSKGAEFTIRFGQCNMRRTRDLNPRGVSYSFTLVISFHPVFLTGVDKAFNIKCFFMEAVKAVDVALDVSPLTTSLIEREFELPQCSYQLRHGYEGPFLKFANIGETVTHVWQCDASAGFIYGLLIHSCYVDDGRGNRYDLVNERGCAIDKYLLADISYDEKSLGAFVNTHVFRYSDRIQLFFTCTLQLCFKEDGGCNGITPPLCSSLEADSSDLFPNKLPDSSNHIPKTVLSPTKRRPIPPGLFESRNILRKLNRLPFLNNAPIETRNIHPETLFDTSFGNPFKDSPITWLKNDSRINLDAINGTNNLTARKYRETTLGEMVTDLSVDLTVLPLNEANKTDYETPQQQITYQKMYCFSLIKICAVLTIYLITTILSSLFTIVYLKRYKIKLFLKKSFS